MNVMTTTWDATMTTVPAIPQLIRGILRKVFEPRVTKTLWKCRIARHPRGRKAGSKIVAELLGNPAMYVNKTFSSFTTSIPQISVNILTLPDLRRDPPPESRHSTMPAGRAMSWRGILLGLQLIWANSIPTGAASRTPT
jgi:hypothetical protein